MNAREQFRDAFSLCFFRKTKMLQNTEISNSHVESESLKPKLSPDKPLSQSQQLVVIPVKKTLEKEKKEIQREEKKPVMFKLNERKESAAGCRETLFAKSEQKYKQAQRKEFTKRNYASGGLNQRSGGR